MVWSSQQLSSNATSLYFGAVRPYLDAGDDGVVHGKRVFSDPRVHLTDWQLHQEGEPKDNDPYNPPGGNYFLSTHKRWGTQDVATTWISETHEMMRQAEKKREKKRVPMEQVVSFATYDDTETAKSLAALKAVGLPEYPATYGLVDYRSTMKRDYVPQMPRLKRQPPPPRVPAEFNRHCLSELSDGASPLRRDTCTFMDDNKQDFVHIPRLRVARANVSFDPTRLRHTLANCPVN